MPRYNSASFLRSVLLLLGCAAASPVLFAAACVSSNQISVSSSSTASSSGAGGAGGKDDGTICVLHNCKSDDDCGACSENRKICNVREHRCVSCDVTSGTGCGEGEFCSDFGTCVPKGLSCEVDDHGIPSIQCAENIDCAACDPAHLVCDKSTSKCVACNESNSSACGRDEVCTPQHTCAPGCPSACNAPMECASCENNGATFACVSNKCVQTDGPDGGSDGGTTSGGGPTQTCHDACSVGDPMLTTCNTCIKAVCGKDSFCCTDGWDAVCVTEVGEYCNRPCTIPPSTCAHNECIVGKALSSGCSTCASLICEVDNFCCNTSWDSICVGRVEGNCGVKCS